MVMLADTDAGSVITAAQSGAKYRFMLVLPLLLLMPASFCSGDDGTARTR